MDDPIIIIGAGAAGLMAAKDLSAAGKAVIILEANSRLGGRIYTLEDEAFIEPVEAGAEFIHGKLPLTLELLKQAKIDTRPSEGKMMHVQKGEWKTENEAEEGWDEVMKRMNEVSRDMSLAKFLQTYFCDEKYVGIRRWIQSFAEGFDLADIDQASTIALREEWKHQERQSRVAGGYQRLIDFLEKECEINHCIIHTSTVVKALHWRKNNVTIITADGETFAGKKAIITVPLGILQCMNNEEAAITFTPSLDEYHAAANKIGYGTVVKVLMQFKHSFWDVKNKKLGFILSDEKIPTWWTQYPNGFPLLTGWLSGAKAKRLALEEEDIMELSIKSLSSIFKMEVSSLKDELTAWKVIDWMKEPFAAGAYSYSTVETPVARRFLNQPIEQTIFFAGEALYEGIMQGTVEAALASGREVAKKIIGSDTPSIK
jgi:monoamine oxidase